MKVSGLANQMESWGVGAKSLHDPGFLYLVVAQDKNECRDWGNVPKGLNQLPNNQADNYSLVCMYLNVHFGKTAPLESGYNYHT